MSNRRVQLSCRFVRKGGGNVLTKDEFTRLWVKLLILQEKEP